MVRPVFIRAALLKLAALALLANGVAALAGCCPAPSAGDGDGRAAIVMPCHGDSPAQDAERERTDAAGQCCLACLPAAAAALPGSQPAPTPDWPHAAARRGDTARTIDPPFRPPTHTFS